MLEENLAKIRKLSNSGNYQKVYDMANSLHKKYPKIIVFEYLEAVYSAEETNGFTKVEVARRYKRAASKLKVLLRKLKNVKPKLRDGIRNEYYWFSKQPYKQYLLGVEQVKKGQLTSYYSQGVGAVELSKLYAQKGRAGLSNKWAIISEKAWIEYFKVESNWYNSYLFYGMALGIQGRVDEMNKAFKKGSKISKIPLNNEVFKTCEREALQALDFNLK